MRRIPRQLSLSVLIITKNRPQLFRQCLGGVLKQQHRPDEIIIIDSSDRAIHLKPFGYNIKFQYHHLPQLTIPQARQTAIKLAKSDLVLFIDDDCVMLPETIMKLRAQFQKNGDVAIVMGELINDSPQNPFAVVQHYYYLEWMRENLILSTKFQQLKDGKVLHFDMLCVRKPYMLQVQFDVEAPPFFQDDDIDVGSQLYRITPHMYYDPSLITSYHPRDNLIALLKRHFYTGFSNHYVYDKKGINVRDVRYSLSGIDKIKEIRRYISEFESLYLKAIFLGLLILSPASYMLGYAYYYIWNNFSMQNKD